MLRYLDEELQYEEFIHLILDKDYSNTYILISDLNLYETKLTNFKLTPKQIITISNFKVILIESWNELYDFINQFKINNENLKKNGNCLIAIYGILRNFLEIGIDEVSNLFLNQSQFSGFELNRLIHKFYVLQQFSQDKLNIILNDGFEKNETSVSEPLTDPIGRNDTLVPLFYSIEVPNIRKINNKINKRILIKDNDNQEDCEMIDIGTILNKWFEVLNLDEFMDKY
ncbi:uncharacterized protein KGF55_002966 [Candida pseudojiufengensis]|uniref:uncharacterized protein n=1 Tax=Candida pseudojiufengensis TaxID=497109 RepID=UPI002224E9D8|nr:uncharacterized protein KGF55_002966 [Candida pseudojiufengensis]KAI5963174.1 hypothetical protein KGF55_002966 [Candida pseudojiufengensis]